MKLLTTSSLNCVVGILFVAYLLEHNRLTKLHYKRGQYSSSRKFERSGELIFL